MGEKVELHCFVCLGEDAPLLRTGCACTSLAAHDACLVGAVTARLHHERPADCAICQQRYPRVKVETSAAERAGRGVARFAAAAAGGVVVVVVGTGVFQASPQLWGFALGYALTMCGTIVFLAACGSFLQHLVASDAGTERVVRIL